MPRTTLDIETPILEELRALQQKEQRSMGKLASELLAEGLTARKANSQKRGAPKLAWISKPMGPARVDIEDKAALWAVLDQDLPVARDVRERRRLR